MTFFTVLFTSKLVWRTVCNLDFSVSFLCLDSIWRHENCVYAMMCAFRTKPHHRKHERGDLPTNTRLFMSQANAFLLTASNSMLLSCLLSCKMVETIFLVQLIWASLSPWSWRSLSTLVLGPLRFLFSVTSTSPRACFINDAQAGSDDWTGPKCIHQDFSYVARKATSRTAPWIHFSLWSCVLSPPSVFLTDVLEDNIFRVRKQ